MKITTAVLWLLVYEALTLGVSGLVLRVPWKDPMDGSTKPTTNQTVVATHLSMYIFLLVVVVFYFIFVRVWRGSNRRRR